MSQLVLREVDEAENHTAVFIYSDQRHIPGPSPTPARVDISPTYSAPSSWSKDGLIALLCDVFLPSGFPESVTADYLPYQIYDSLQAFCSSIAGLLSSRAVLQGVGVGNANASPTNALLLHILQDTSGRIATILFAHRVGTALEPECKTYRLAADVFNDIAMILDCLSPMVPSGMMRVSILSTAGVLRALCGVAGGSSKASLSAHFAKRGNLAELNAKDSSQETIISLLGMLVGSIVVSNITNLTTTWICLLFLLASHLTLNHAAVRSVQMTSLNRQRASMVFSTIIESDNYATKRKAPQPGVNPNHKTNLIIPTPEQISRKERILQIGSPFFWSSLASIKPRQSLGTFKLGVSLAEFFADTYETIPYKSATPIPVSTPTPTSTLTHSFRTSLPLPNLKTLFEKESYILNLTRKPQSQQLTQSPTPIPQKWTAKVLLKHPSTPKVQIKSFCHALLAARILSELPPADKLSLPPPPPSMNGTGTGTRGAGGGANANANGSPQDNNSSPGLNPNNPAVRHAIRTAEVEREVVLSTISETLGKLNEADRFGGYLSALEVVGWDLSISMLEVRAGKRVFVDEDEMNK